MVPRFFVPALPEQAEGGVVPLPAPVARQVALVLRLGPGARLVLFDGSGAEWEAELASVEGHGRSGRHAATARLVRRRQPAVEPALRLTLYQALLKGEKLEWVLQKGTELGVARFVPMVTERTVRAGHGATPSPERLERWRRIVVEAAEQCGRVLIPAVCPPVPFAAALRRSGRAILCWEGERVQPFARALAEALRAGGAEAAPTASPELGLFIGPEGGFTAGEVEAARAAGVLPASLGPRVLRAETAAIAAATLALLGELAPREA